jgi:hypothetical protein
VTLVTLGDGAILSHFTVKKGLTPPVSLNHAFEATNLAGQGTFPLSRFKLIQEFYRACGKLKLRDRAGVNASNI